MPPGCGLNPYYEDDGVVIYHGDCCCVLPTLAANSMGRPPAPWRGISDVIEWEREYDSIFHPTNYPLIAAYAPPGGLVLDPFMGSGSTLRAAKDFGLSAIGIEVEERYCRYAAGRMRQRILFARPVD